MEVLQTVIVTGLSGSGKTNAIDWFEDRGYYCVDNMPPALIRDFIELTALSKKKIDKAAFVVDVRGGEFFSDLVSCIADLRKDERIDCKVLFIEASDETLIKRYNETRRNHPLAAGSTSREVIEKEKETLADVRATADYIIDTTGMKVAGLKREIERLFGEEKGGSSFAVNIMSFGFKKGIPAEADMVLDMRFIPNPYYVKSLKKLTGNNKKVYDYVMRQKVAADFAEKFESLLMEMIPAYIKEGKYHLNVAFGCTGGQHRSVTMANCMYRRLNGKEGLRLTLEHRDI